MRCGYWRKICGWKVLFLLFPYWAGAQVEDSLRAELERISAPLERVAVYEQLVNVVRGKDPNLAISYVYEMLDQARLSGDSVWVGKSFHKLGVLQKQFGQLEKSLESLEYALQVFRQARDSSGISSSLNGIGVIHKNMGNLDLAIDFYGQSLAIAKARVDSASIAKTYNNIGLAYQIKGDYEKALQYFISALRIKERISGARSLVPAYNNLGLAYMQLMQNELAIEYFSKALELAQSLENQRMEATLYANMGQAYLKNDQLNESIRNLNKSVEIRELLKDDIGLADSYMNFAELWRVLREYEKAINYLQKANRLYTENKYYHKLDELCFLLGKTYYQLKQYPQAKKWFIRSVEYANQNKTTRFLLLSYDYLSKIYYLLQSYEQAYHYLKLNKILGDSLQNDENARKIAEMRLQFEADYNKKTIASLRDIAEIQGSEKRRNYIFFISSFIAFLVTIIVAFLLYRQYKLARETQDKLNETNQLLEAKNEELQGAVSQVQDALQVRSEFITTVSHEIRTPLNAIIGMNHLLQETELTPEQRKYVVTVANSSSNLLLLLNDILDFSRIEATRIELEIYHTNLHELLEGLSELFETDFSKQDLTFHSRIDKELPRWVLADGARLRQVLINLLSNALKFTHAGEVSFSAETLGKEKTLNGFLYQVRFQVQDTGIGIPEERLNSIFEAFQQVDSSVSRQYGGVGLGLSISQKLVSLMGGNLRVQSKEGEGSTFFFDLQLKAVEHSIEASDIVQAPIRFNREMGMLYPLQILIVEDNEVNSDLLRISLGKMGYQPALATNGVEALEQLDERSFDYILMDIQMPVMDGITTTAEIRKRYGDQLPVIVAITADRVSLSEEDYQKMGFQDFITKPFETKDLEASLKRWHGEIQALRENN